MGISARIILDSVNPANIRLVSWEVTIPRMFLAEWNTHCVIARNSASSRAIPSERLIAAVRAEPYLPVFYGKNKPGMQATEEMTAEEKAECEAIILEMRDFNARGVERLTARGMHKQDANRYIEPWMYTTIIATMTDHQNFLKLRASAAAQPAFAQVAYAMQKEYYSHEPTPMPVGGWHLPLIDDSELVEAIKIAQYDFEHARQILTKVSVARCARVSYVRQHDRKPFTEDIALHDRLRDSGHWSPFEHQAFALGTRERIAKYRGWRAYRKCFLKEVEGEEV
jgi:thymidylate synthase ThyX